MTQTAKILEVFRGTLYYWVKKGWIKPERDYRDYPIFTTLDIKNIIKWKQNIQFCAVGWRKGNETRKSMFL